MSLKTFKKEAGLAVVAAGLMLSAGAQAGSLTNPALVPGAFTTGWYDIGGTLVPATPVPDADLPGLLTGSPANAGGNVELGFLGIPPATGLTGLIDGAPILMEGLVATDWTADGTTPGALVYDYVDNAAASLSISLTAPERDAIATQFLLPILPGGNAAWQLLSDPNVSFVMSDSDSIDIGLAGFLNAGTVLRTLFAGILDPAELAAIPDDAGASEVVKVTYDGVTDYLFSFDAISSGMIVEPTLGLPDSYDGTYIVEIDTGVEPVPVPATLGLMLLGFAVMKRRFA